MQTMRDKIALPVSQIGLGALPTMLDRAAFALLIAVGLCFAIEFRQPLMSLGGMSLTNIEALMALTFAAWLGSRVLAGRMPRVPSMIAAPMIVWLVVLALSTGFAPAYQRQAMLFMGRTI